MLTRLSCFDIRNAGGFTFGFVDFTKEFKHLGSIIDSSLTSDADVDMRIKAATSAFGTLKNVRTSLSVDLRVRGRFYNALVFSILLIAPSFDVHLFCSLHYWGVST